MIQILMRDLRTDRYLDCHDGWTKDEKRARRFPTTLNAVVYAVQMDFHNMQLVVRVTDEPWVVPPCPRARKAKPGHRVQRRPGLPS